MAPTVGMMSTTSDAPPSPLMTKAYKGHEITKDESEALVEFFKKVNPEEKSGGAGALILDSWTYSPPGIFRRT